jgi:hypothetical protein
MTIHAGSHELYGTFVLKRPSAQVLADWLSLQRCETDFDRRDLVWWLERIAVFEGSTIELFEAERSSYATVDARIGFVAWLAGEARSGRAFVQHVDNGYRLTTFTVRDGVVAKDTTSGRWRPLAELPSGTRAERNAEIAAARQERERQGRPPEEHFAEFLVRDARQSRMFFLVHGDPQLIAQAAARIQAAAGEDIPFVADLGALAPQEQKLLWERMREGERFIIGSPGDADALVITGKLFEPLYDRLRTGAIDLRRARPAG